MRSRPRQAKAGKRKPRKVSVQGTASEEERQVGGRPRPASEEERQVGGRPRPASEEERQVGGRPRPASEEERQVGGRPRPAVNKTRSCQRLDEFFFFFSRFEGHGTMSIPALPSPRQDTNQRDGVEGRPE